MTKKNFQNTVILGDVLNRYQVDNELLFYDDDQIFEIFAIQQITKGSNLSFLEVEDGVVDGPSDGGIDSFLVLINDIGVATIEELEDISFGRDSRVRVYISQAKLGQSFQEKALEKLNVTAPMIFDLEVDEQALWLRFNTKLVEKILLLRRVWRMAVENHVTIEIFLSYACKANEVHINHALRQMSQQICKAIEDKTLRACKVSFNFFSAKELIELFQKPQSTSLKLKFKEYPTPIEYKRGEYAYIGVVYLRDYYDFIVDSDGTIRERILEENVRHYQGEVDVNKGIRRTLEDDFSVDFWWLNNGITIIASKCTAYPRVLHLDDVQIVNGLQTSYTIGRFYERNQENDERAILVKVLIVSSEEKQTIDKIISSSNKQNPVTPTVLRATDDIQRKLELFFFNRGYYYDRRKNYYKNQNKPANRIFSIQYTAQAIEAVLNFNPSAARSKPTTLIKTDKTYQRIFDEGRSFEAYLKCCLLYQYCANFIKTKLPREDRSEFRNYTYHLTRVVAALLADDPRYDAEKFRELDATNIDQSIIERGYNILKTVISQYQQENPDVTFANYVSKAARFTNMLNDHLDTIFSAQ